ncbi:MAG: MFS transporter, partial [Planctomycetes bacterium]|nr:MFS transporter [Planctomycetota bacterium]
TCPSRFKDDNVVAASTGFIDGMGYIGTVLIGIIVPVLVDMGKGKWNYVFTFWVVLSFVAAISVTLAYFLHFKRNNACKEEASLNP